MVSYVSSDDDLPVIWWVAIQPLINNASLKNGGYNPHGYSDDHPSVGPEWVVTDGLPWLMMLIVVDYYSVDMVIMFINDA